MKIRRLFDYGSAQERWANELRRDQLMITEYGKFLETLLPWEWDVTITFRHPVARGWALAAIEKYLREIRHAAGHPIGWVIAEAYGEIGGRYHVHILID